MRAPQASKVRVWMGVAMCCTTRCITGLTIAPTANSQSIRMLLRMSLTDKSAMASAVGALTPWEYNGTLDEFYVDEGSSNINEDVPLNRAELKIGFNVPQAEMPTQRGKIEPLLHTLDIRGIARFSGRTFKNPVVRGKYDSLARACVTVHEPCALIVRFSATCSSSCKGRKHSGDVGLNRSRAKRYQSIYPYTEAVEGRQSRSRAAASMCGFAFRRVYRLEGRELWLPISLFRVRSITNGSIRNIAKPSSLLL
jgi:hypothetical protein